MARPSGETWGSAAHRRSNTSIALKAGLFSAKPGAANATNTISAAESFKRAKFLLTMFLGLFAGRPAVTLMFVHDTHRLHERVANGGAHEFESLPLQLLAHGIAVRRRCGETAEIQRSAPLNLAVGELPQIVAKGS